MSNAYISEPPTNGKIIVHTTLGPLEIELWPKETPKACRNFIQLCLEGYYDGTIFHRVVKNFIVQGGDPTGTGHGGESIYGAPFPDEFHSRLRFSHRGLLAMANTGSNENGSQFFFTLDRADELNRQNTIFGKIVGDTIYNLLKFGELETDADEKPLYPPKITRMEVLYNPFDDIVPRTTPEEKAAMAAAEKKRRAKEEAARKPKGKRNLSLLSFGEEAEPDSSVLPPMKAKIKSSHDVLVDDPRLSREVAVDIPADSTSVVPSKSDILKSKVHKRRGDSDSDDDEDNRDFDNRMREKVKKRKRKELEDEKQSVATKSSKMSSIESEIAQVRSEIRALGSGKAENAPAPKVEKERLVDKMRAEYTQAGKAVSAKKRKLKGEQDTLELLKKFQSKLWKTDAQEQKQAKADPKAKEGSPQAESEDQECPLHFVKNCESCRDTFGRASSIEQEDDSGWLATKLVFEKEKGANVYEARVEDYTVIDPRAGAKVGDFTGAAVAKKAKETRGSRDRGRDARDKQTMRDAGKDGRDRTYERRRDDDRGYQKRSNRRS